MSSVLVYEITRTASDYDNNRVPIFASIEKYQKVKPESWFPFFDALSRQRDGVLFGLRPKIVYTGSAYVFQLTPGSFLHDGRAHTLYEPLNVTPSTDLGSLTPGDYILTVRYEDSPSYYVQRDPATGVLLYVVQERQPYQFTLYSLADYNALDSATKEKLVRLAVFEAYDDSGTIKYRVKYDFPNGRDTVLDFEYSFPYVSDNIALPAFDNRVDSGFDTQLTINSVTVSGTQITNIDYTVSVTGGSFRIHGKPIVISRDLSTATLIDGNGTTLQNPGFYNTSVNLTSYTYNVSQSVAWNENSEHYIVVYLKLDSLTYSQFKLYALPDVVSIDAEDCVLLKVFRIKVKDGVDAFDGQTVTDIANFPIEIESLTHHPTIPQLERNWFNKVIVDYIKIANYFATHEQYETIKNAIIGTDPVIEDGIVEKDIFVTEIDQVENLANRVAYLEYYKTLYDEQLERLNAVDETTFRYVVTTTTLTSDDRVVIVEANSGSINIYLPTPNKPTKIRFKRVDDTDNNVYVRAASGTTIDRTRSYVELNANYYPSTSLELLYDPNKKTWYVL